VWRKGGKKAKARVQVQNDIVSTLLSSYKNVKQTPDDMCKALIANKKSKFSPEELESLLAAFKRVTSDRLQAGHFCDIVGAEMGWTNTLLRKQLFRAFDQDGHGDITFLEFVQGYSVMIRGNVGDMINFAWDVYHITGPKDALAITDLFTVLRLALEGLSEVRNKLGINACVTLGENLRFPDRTARQMITKVFGDRNTPLSKDEFSHLVLANRRFVEILIPGFEMIPLDPLHHAVEIGDKE